SGGNNTSLNDLHYAAALFPHSVALPRISSLLPFTEPNGRHNEDAKERFVFIRAASFSERAGGDVHKRVPLDEAQDYTADVTFRPRIQPFSFTLRKRMQPVVSQNRRTGGRLSCHVHVTSEVHEVTVNRTEQQVGDGREHELRTRSVVQTADDNELLRRSARLLRLRHSSTF
ncbi:uncharacterized, partial [Tachysurus ichikawai]